MKGHGDMSHQHHHHGDSIAGVGDTALLWALALNIGLSVFEFAAGLFAGSMALLADALHNTNDAAALLIAFVARKISRRGPDARFTFGYQRAELVGAMIQLTALIIVGFYLTYEAIHRLFAPEPIAGGWMMAASGIAIIVDLGTVWLLWAMAKGSLNVKAAFLHNLTDAVASFAVLAGGMAVYWLNWNWVDPVLTLGIAGYILYMSFVLLKRTSGILMGNAPPGLDVYALGKAVEALDGVMGVHHLHVWELTESRRALEAHVVIEDASIDRLQSIKLAIKERLKADFGIGHSTLEFETFRDRCVEGPAAFIHEKG